MAAPQRQPNEQSSPQDEEYLPAVSPERREQARDNLRKRFPEMTDQDFDDMSRETTRTSKFRVFMEKLMQKYKWSRGVCQQQLGEGFDDIRDC